MESLQWNVLRAAIAVFILAATGCPNPGPDGESSEKALTSFSFLSPAASGTIDEGAKTVSMTVPFGTDVTSLVTVFATTGASVKVGTIVQISGYTPNNFSDPVPYVVTAADGSTVIYTVTVTIAASPAKALTSFSFQSPAVTGTIDEGAKNVAVAVPFGTDVTSLVAVFATTGASVKVGSVVQASGVTPNDFSDPVPYVVTAADRSTATYTVTVTVALPLPGMLVINEVDYDQNGTDAAEFIELYNPGDSPFALQNLALVLVTGSTNIEYARVLLGEGSLGPRAHLIVCAAGMATPPTAQIVLRFAGETNCIQNGAPDAVLVYDTLTKVVIDALTYEGGSMDAVTLTGETGTFDATEGQSASAADSNTVAGSLIRWPNGTDTDDNDADFVFSTTPTPAAANSP